MLEMCQRAKVGYHTCNRISEFGPCARGAVKKVLLGAEGNAPFLHPDMSNSITMHNMSFLASKDGSKKCLLVQAMRLPGSWVDILSAEKDMSSAMSAAVLLDEKLEDRTLAGGLHHRSS